MNQEITIPQNASFWAQAPSNVVSKDYKFMPTSRVTDFFKEKGFYITSYSEQRAYRLSNVGKAKHLIRMRRIGDDRKDAPEILIINSHNRYSSLKINIGIYRIACSNGLILGDTFYTNKVIHAGETVYNQLSTILLELDKKFEQLDGILTAMKNTQLDVHAKQAFMQSLLENRFKTSKREISLTNADFIVNMLPLRKEDMGSDIYTVMNIVQEKLIGGNFKFHFKNEKGYQEQGTTKRVKSINQLMDINQNIFEKAMALV